MRRHWILDEQGEPAEAELLEWARWYETADRRLARDEVGHYVVSTVFLGLDYGFSSTDHSFLPNDVPILWETMIFDQRKHHSDLDKSRERYSSRADALRGHARMVERARLALRLEDASR